MAELVPYFEKTNIDWERMSNSSLIQFYFHTQLYIINFNFPGKDGLENFKSNLHTLLKECKNELSVRGIRIW